MLAAVMPLPSEEVTPPVTKTYFAMGWVLRGFFQCYRKTPGSAIREPLEHPPARRTRVSPGRRIRAAARPRAVLHARSPDLRAAEDRVAGRVRECAAWILLPAVQPLVQPGVDLGKLGPALERPAVVQADRDERSLGEDHVGIAGRVAIALAIADEHDGPAGGLVGQHPLALAGPAHRQSGWPFGQPIRACRPSNVVRAVITGRSASPSRARAGPMKNPKPSLTTSTGIPAAGRSPGERHEARVVGLDRGRGQQLGLGGVDQGDLPLHQPPGPHPARVVDRRDALPVRVRDVLGHDRVGHVGQGDRAVVVDQDRQRGRIRRERLDRPARRWT